ncbi:MAG: hypothetical protein NT159_20365 [Proteobacteria bacterium]|nr:hypothetical protein [Pseudomonadota bacterium]
MGAFKMQALWKTMLRASGSVGVTVCLALLVSILSMSEVSALTFQLSVANSGSGYGNVGSVPSSISCYVPQPSVYYLVAPDCSENYAAGTSVTLTATPANGSAFIGWGGDCTGTGACTLAMSAARTVTANFISTSTTSGADCLFNWAERTAPQFFAPAGGASLPYAPYYYRYYSGTGNYLATSSAGDRLWATGTATGGKLLDLGLVTSYLDAAGCAR